MACAPGSNKDSSGSRVAAGNGNTPRMEEPARAERLWLAVAIATWWLLAVGGEADAEIREETLAPVHASAAAKSAALAFDRRFPSRLESDHRRASVSRTATLWKGRKTRTAGPKPFPKPLQPPRRRWPH